MKGGVGRGGGGRGIKGMEAGVQRGEGSKREPYKQVGCKVVNRYLSPVCSLPRRRWGMGEKEGRGGGSKLQDHTIIFNPTLELTPKAEGQPSTTQKRCGSLYSMEATADFTECEINL